MEKQNREIKLLNGSLLFSIASFLVFYFVFLLQSIVYRLFFGYEVKGKENLKSIEKAVFVSNHCHYLDPGFIASAVFPKKIYFTGLERTFAIRGLSLFIRLLRSLPIPEDNPGRIVKSAGRLLNAKKPISIHLFPEGTMLQKNTQLHDFHSGAFSLADFFKVPVVPITEMQIERRFFFPKIILHVEKPIDIAKEFPALKKHERISAASLLAQETIQKRLERISHIT